MPLIGKAGKAGATAAIAALALRACGRAESPATGGTAGGEAFPKDSSIRVALPQKISENWVLAEKLFNDGLRMPVSWLADFPYLRAVPRAPKESITVKDAIPESRKMK